MRPNVPCRLGACPALLGTGPPRACPSPPRAWAWTCLPMGKGTLSKSPSPPARLSMSCGSLSSSALSMFKFGSNSSGWEKLTECRGPCRRALVRACLRLPSVYPCGDPSQSQFFVEEGVSNGEIDSERLASSCRGRAHGTLVVPAIAARRTPRLLMSLGNDVPLVDEEGYPYLVR
jgi:hypothetical protein